MKAKHLNSDGFINAHGYGGGGHGGWHGGGYFGGDIYAPLPYSAVPYYDEVTVPATVVTTVPTTSKTNSDFPSQPLSDFTPSATSKSASGVSGAEKGGDSFSISKTDVFIALGVVGAIVAVKYLVSK